MIVLYILLAFAMYNIAFAVVMHTKNLISAVLFKVIPMFGGLTLAIYCMKQLGWL